MDKLKNNGKANVMHFNVMLLACEGIGEMRRVIETGDACCGSETKQTNFPNAQEVLICMCHL